MRQVQPHSLPALSCHVYNVRGESHHHSSFTIHVHGVRRGFAAIKPNKRFEGLCNSMKACATLPGSKAACPNLPPHVKTIRPKHSTGFSLDAQLPIPNRTTRQPIGRIADIWIYPSQSDMIRLLCSLTDQYRESPGIDDGMLAIVPGHHIMDDAGSNQDSRGFAGRRRRIRDRG